MQIIMKTLQKLVVLTLLIMFSVVAQAQEKGKGRVFAGLAMGTKSAVDANGGEKLGLGLTFGGDYFILDNLSAGLNYTFFFKSSYGDATNGVSLQASALNIDGHYYFVASSPLYVYGLFGFSIGYAKAEYNIGLINLNGTVKDNKFGINLGAGLDYYLSDKFFLNGQIKYNSPHEQMVFNVGFGYVVN